MGSRRTLPTEAGSHTFAERKSSGGSFCVSGSPDHARAAAFASARFVNTGAIALRYSADA
jgi:hypothetical protein